VPVVFGAQWLPAVVPLRILAVSGPAVALVRLNGNLWEAMGRAGLTLAMSAVALGLLLPGFVLGVRYGVIGVATAYSVTAYLGLFPAMVVTARTNAIGMGRQLANVFPVLVATTAMVVVGLLIDQWIPVGGDVVPLLAMIAGGAATYAVMLFLLDRRLVTDALSDLRPGS
jgi:O-antigen/teichoic acid export membrane protein